METKESKKIDSAALSETLCEDIFEQLEVWKNILTHLPNQLDQIQMPPARTQSLIGIAEGSSKNVLAMAQPFLEAWTDIPFRVYNPNTMASSLYIADTTMGDAGLFQYGYFIAVSQSGETTSIINALKTLETHLLPNRQQTKLPLMLMTNVQDSTLEKTYGNRLPIGAGKENYIAATKTMTASLLSLLLWGLHWGKQLARLTNDDYTRLLTQLRGLPDALELLLQRKRPLNRILSFTQKLTEVNHFILLSKGPLVNTLPESALKLIETSSNIAYIDNSESFKHGPKVMLAGVNEATPNTIYVIPPDQEFADGIFQDMRNHFAVSRNHHGFSTDRLFIIRFENSPLVPDELFEQLELSTGRILTLPAANSIFETYFLSLVTFQLISFFLAWLKGESPDNPALRKAVID